MLRHKAPSKRQLQAICDRFNKQFPVGSRVLLRRDTSEVLTQVVGEATVLGGHSAVAQFKDVSGAYSIEDDRVTHAPVSFEVSESDRLLINAIVARAMPTAIAEQIDTDEKELSMDITACHANGCPLDLQKLLDAPDIHFGHDVWGIRRFIDRDTGMMPQNKFAPRCMARES